MITGCVRPGGAFSADGRSTLSDGAGAPALGCFMAQRLMNLRKFPSELRAAHRAGRYSFAAGFFALVVFVVFAAGLSFLSRLRFKSASLKSIFAPPAGTSRPADQRMPLTTIRR